MVSLIIITYNEENYISNNLQSLLGQTYRPFEIIVSDGSSTDNTIKRIVEFRDSFVEKGVGFTIVTGKKKNASYGRNLGAKHAKYDELIFLDADIVLPNNLFLEGFMNWVKANNIEIASGGTYSRGVLGGYCALMGNMLYSITGIIPGDFVYIKRNLFSQIGGFDEDYDVAEGVDLGFKTWLLTNKIPSRYLDRLAQADYERRLSKRYFETIEAWGYGILSLLFNQPVLQKLSKPYW